MKESLGKSGFLFVAAAMVQVGWGQVTLPHTEPFDYTAAGALQTQSGWTALNTGDNIAIASGSLSYSGMPASSGNKISFDGAGIDAAKAFTPTSSGTVYLSFLLNVSALGSLNTTGGYFAAFTESANTTFGPTIWLRKGSGTNYQIGLNPRTTAANTVWDTVERSLNSTVLVVASYEFVASTTNDIVRLWINPSSLGGSEPAATLTATNALTDLANTSRVLIRQDSTTATSFVELDELRIGTSFAAVTPASSPSITGTATATAFTTTYGTASAAQTFPISGANLTGAITATAPSGIEVSSDGTTYGPTATFAQTGGSASGTLSVRLAANAPVVGTYNSQNIALTSAGATTVNITTAASGNAVSTKALTITANDVTKAFGATLASGPGSTAFGSSGLAGIETIGSVTITYGTGAAAGDAVGTYTGQVTPSAATGGTFTASNYAISYVAGSITVTAGPTITISGTLTAVNTTYGIASPTPASFTVAGGNLTGNLTVTAPAGYEVSTVIGSGYAGNLQLTQSGGNVSTTTIYVRLAASTGAGSYSGNVAVSGGGATTQNVPTVSSTVAQKGLTITGLTGANKEYDRTNTASVTGTAALSGVVGTDNVTLGGSASFVFADGLKGDAKPITASGYTLGGTAAGNYTLSQPTGLTANITAKALTVTGAAVTDKPYNGTSAATITGTLSGVLSPDVVTFNGTGTFASVNVGIGIAVTSTSTLGGADAGNYSLTQPTGLTGNIIQGSQTITFGTLPGKFVGDAPFALTATATSGLTVSFASSNEAVATVSGSTVTIVGAGTTTITASQAGDTNYAAATPVGQTLTVTSTSGGTTLAAGDVAIIGYNAAGTPDSFTILVLKDLAAGTVFFASDNEVTTDGGTSFADVAEMEASFVVKAGQTVPAGTVIVLPWGGAAVSATTYDWSATTGAGLNNGPVDEIYLYSAATISDLTPTAFLFGAKLGTGTGLRPAGLTSGTTWLTFGAGVTASRYKTSGAVYSGSQTVILAAIGNTAANWEAVAPVAATDWSFAITPDTGSVDGQGTVAASNGGAAPLGGTNLFRRNQTAQTVALTVTGVASAPITTVEVDVPTGWTGLAVGNVALSGAFTGATPSVTGNTIRVSGASLTNAAAGIITVSGLATPNPVALTDTGSYTFTSRTAGAGGTLTALFATQPTLLVTIPIVNLSDNDANGVALDLGRSVAIEGVATPAVSFSASATPPSLNTFFQDATDGIGTFLSNGNAVTQGNLYVVRGTVAQFRGATQLSPPSNADVISLGADTVPTPTLKTIAEILATPEAFEGQLLRINGVQITSGTWPAEASDGDLVISTDGGTTGLALRIDLDTDVDGSTQPTGAFSVVGILTQFDTDNTAPFDSGYQIVPRALTDIITTVIPGIDLTIAAAAPSTGVTNVAFDYTITVANAGTVTATGVSAEFTVPAGLTYGSNNTGTTGFTGAFDAGKRKVTFSGGTLNAGANAVLTVRVTPPTAATYTAAAGAAVVDAGNTVTETNETNNSSTAILSTVVTDTPVLSATLANLTPQPSGNLTAGTSNAVLAGFTVTAAGGSLDFTGVTVTLAGTALAADLSGFRIFRDNDGNGAINGGDISVSGSLAHGASLAFTLTGQTISSTAFSYLIVADVAPAATNGRTVTASIGAAAFTTSAGTRSGSATGQSRTISATPVAPTFTTQPANQSITSGSTATLTSLATGFPAPSYQWYIGTRGDVSNLIGGATSASYTTPALTVTTSYWVRATNSQGSVDSNTAVVTVTVVPSADLASLTIPGVTLSPTFAPAVKSYSATVLGALNQVAVTATAQTGATISVNGVPVASGVPSQTINLALGNNTIQVAVSQGALAETYVVNIFRGNDATGLSGLSLSQGTLSPSFSSGQITYTATVPFTATSITVTPVSSAIGAAIQVNGFPVVSGLASSPVSLNPGANLISVVVTSQDGTAVQTFGITVTRQADNRLSALGVSSGVLSPAFDSSVTSYTVRVPFETTEWSATPTVSAPLATVTVGGVSTASGSASTPTALVVGANLIVIQVTGTDSATRSYNVTVTREADPSLAALEVEGATLDPVFSPAVTAYSSVVDSSVTSVRVRPTVAAVGATVMVNGTAVASGVFSSPISLNGGPNLITLNVSAIDGLGARAYVLTINRTGSEIDVRAGSVSLVNGTSTYSMGGTSPGRIRTRELTIRNLGAEALTGLAVQVTGDPEFSASLNGVTSIPGGESATLVLSFAPTDTSAKTASVSITNSDSDENPFVFTVTASGDFRMAKPVEHPAGEAEGKAAARAAWESGFTGIYDGLVRNQTDGTTLLGSVSRLVVSAPSEVNGGGVLSGTLLFRGRTVALKGAFRPGNGAFESTTDFTDGARISLALQLMRTTPGGEFVIRGSAFYTPALGARINAIIDLNLAPYGTNLPAPTPLVGRYTLIIPGEDGWGNAQPGGDGWATISISSAGVLSLTGTLGDGTKITETSYLSAGGEASLYTDLYKTAPERGRFGGKVTFRDQPGISDFDGIMQWVKFADSREASYPGGFDLDVWAIGGKYIAPIAGQLILTQLAPELHNAELALIGPTAPAAGAAALERVVTWQTTNRIVHYGKDRLSAVATAATGQVGGSYVDPVSRAVTAFNGVALQKQGVAGGLFVTGGKSGALRILPGTDYTYPGSEDPGALPRAALAGSAAVGPTSSDVGFAPEAAGVYNGTLENVGTASGALQNVTFTATGGLSGTIWIEGVREAFSGSLGTPITTASGATVTLRITLVAGTTDSFGLAGTIVAGGVNYTARAERRTVFTSTARAPQTGNYTVVVQAPTGVNPALRPGGDGYGALVVSFTGACSGTITLGDGTRVTMAGSVGKSYLEGSADAAEWNFHTGLYGKVPKGYLAGRLTFRAVSGISDLDGKWRWVKKPGAAPTTVYGGGFDENRNVIGSRYAAPATGIQAMDGLASSEHNVWLRWSGPDLSTLAATTVTSLDRVGTWSTANTITFFGPERVKLRFNVRTGLLTGSYADPGNGISIGFGGALLQSQDLLSGTFLAQGKSGIFSMDPR